MWHAWEREEICTGFWWERAREKDNLKDKGVDGRKKSKWTLERLVVGCGVDSPGIRKGPVAGCFEGSDKPSGSGTTEIVSDEVRCFLCGMD
jgi:hypothetical protein